LEFDDKALYEASGAVKPRRKRVKREAIVGPAADKDIVHEAVGLKPAFLVPKEIPVIKKKNPVLQVIFCLIEMFFGFSDHFYKCSCSSIVLLQIKIAPRVTQNEHKDDNIATESEDPDKEGLDQRPYATAEEIESKRLAPEEILSLPKFKVPGLENFK
jgi:U11/U12 small nuclear ribonucleoprotein SNRNP65